tara:strand:- start:4465 stop:6165 length:1701 start_codon:yes stop_codon:yes gene_type:complete
MNDAMYAHDEQLVEKWEPVLEGISDDYTQRVTAQLLENQAKSIVSQRMDEALSDGATTTGKLGTFQKFAFPIVRRVYPALLANSLVGVQPMQGPVSQVFYLGNSRAKNGGGSGNEQVVYSKFNLTYRGMTASAIGSLSGGYDMTNMMTNHDETGTPGTIGTMGGNNEGAAPPPSGAGLDGDYINFDTSNVLLHPDTHGTQASAANGGVPSGTFGGSIASWPAGSSILGYSLSSGERLDGNQIPEINFHIEQQAVVARTRKMRALWTIEASQDLKAYHNLDLEKELTGLLANELQLEIDRELIEDLRMIAYGKTSGAFGGADFNALAGGNPNNFGTQGGTGESNMENGGDFIPAAFTYDFVGGGTELGSKEAGSNVFAIDFSQTNLTLAPRHVGEVYANLLAVINLASQDIYRTTMRGPGTWILTSPLVASLLESAAKLEGGVAPADKPTNIGNAQIQYKGKFAGKYDLYVDPMYPQDEIMVGYKGANAMDAGMVYCPYIPLQQLPTVTDPDTFQPRKGIMTRYGKVAIQPADRFYRIIRIVGPTAQFLFTPFMSNSTTAGAATPAY